MRQFASFVRDDRGSVAVIFAMALVGMLVVAGMGIDYGRKVALETEMQQALDSAVLAAVQFDIEKRDEGARKFFDAGMGSGRAENLHVSFTSEGADKVSGSARAELRTTLTGLLGVSTLAVTTTAVAEASGSSQVCVLALSKTASQQLLFNSGAHIEAPTCEVHGKSTASPAAIFNAGTALNTARICLAGSSIIDNGGSHPNLQTKCAAASDPFAGTLPNPVSTACTFNNGNYNGGNVTLSPGVYCGWFNFNSAPNVTFLPGLYVIKNGGWNVNGGMWRGDGVTFHYADTSKIQFNSAVDVKMTPPSSGTYANIMMYEAPNLATSQFVFNDAKDMQMGGLIYLPSRDVTFNSGSKLTTKSFTLVVNTLILNQTNWELTPAIPGIGGGSGSKFVRLSQ